MAAEAAEAFDFFPLPRLGDAEARTSPESTGMNAAGICGRCMITG